MPVIFCVMHIYKAMITIQIKLALVVPVDFVISSIWSVKTVGNYESMYVVLLLCTFSCETKRILYTGNGGSIRRF